MKFTPHNQDSIIALLTRIYTDIAAIEQEYGLLVGEGDFRVRIEYFHDAVRAFSAQPATHRQAGGRLAVELLAHDVTFLRQLQNKPLLQFKPHPHGLSPSGALMKVAPGSLSAQSTRPDRATRDRLSELYQNYAVMFAALLKPMADQDYYDRTDTLNEAVVDVGSVIAELEGKARPEKLADMANHLDDEQLRVLINKFIQSGKYKKKDDITKLIAYLKIHVKQYDKDIKDIDKAHLEYSMSQLGIYEESRDMLKKMAKNGMNLVGNFVENALKDTSKGRGR